MDLDPHRDETTTTSGPERSGPTGAWVLHVLLALIASFFAFLSYVFNCVDDGCIWQQDQAAFGDRVAARVFVAAAWIGAGALWAAALSVWASGRVPRWIRLTASLAWLTALVALVGLVAG